MLNCWLMARHWGKEEELVADIYVSKLLFTLKTFSIRGGNSTNPIGVSQMSHRLGELDTRSLSLNYWQWNIYVFYNSTMDCLRILLLIFLFIVVMLNSAHGQGKRLWIYFSKYINIEVSKPLAVFVIILISFEFIFDKVTRVYWVMKIRGILFVQETENKNK